MSKNNSNENLDFTKVDLRVVGLGGGGGNSLNTMISEKLSGVSFLYLNTDQQALNQSDAPTLLIGPNLTRGRGSGGKPEVGSAAAKESADDIEALLDGCEVLFITTGLGGGTGTGSAPNISEIARSKGILTICVVTRPFSFEGPKRAAIAQNSIEILKKTCDALIVIPNDKLLTTCEADINIIEAFKNVDKVLFRAVQGISDLISKPGIINVDFADIESALKGMGESVIGVAEGEGKLRATDAAEKAINSPLLESTNISNARSILVNIASKGDLKLSEYQAVGSVIAKYIGEDTNVCMGMSLNEELEEKVRVTIVLAGIKTGFSGAANQHQLEQKTSFEDYLEEKDKEARKRTLTSSLRK